MPKLCAFSRFNLPKFSVTPPGSHMRDEFSECISDEGIPGIKIVGQYDVQAQIDSFADECDIYKILDRLGVSTKTPDVVLEAISQFCPDMFVPGKFGDFSNLPDNIHEVAKFYRDSVDFFNKLPSEVRAEYGFSVDKFFADFDSFVSKYASPVAEPAVAPSKEGDVVNE